MRTQLIIGLILVPLLGLQADSLEEPGESSTIRPVPVPVPTALPSTPASLPQETSVSKAQALLAQVREDLRTSEEAQRQVRERLQVLTQQPGSDPELIKEYAEYLQRLEALSAAHRSKLAELEKIYAGRERTGDEQAPPPLQLDDDEKWKAPDTPHAAEGSLESLEAELDSSLNEFDDFLLREQDMLDTEMEHIASRAKSAIDALTARANETAEGLKQKGEQPPAAARTAEAEKTATAEEGAATPKTRRGDAASDDVVARQLREAAENEKDPVLREKLWAEYDAYKEGIAE